MLLNLFARYQYNFADKINGIRRETGAVPTSEMSPTFFLNATKLVAV
jgi:hypothetical protein